MAREIMRVLRIQYEIIQRNKNITQIDTRYRRDVVCRERGVYESACKQNLDTARLDRA